MANMSLKRNEMPTQDPVVRGKNFDEVALGYSEEQAIDEANRCLNCKNKPCVDGCPVKIHIPEFIAKIKEGEFEEAYQIITNHLRCLLYAEEYAPRNLSVNQNVYAVSRAKVLVLADLSALSLTGTIHFAQKNL